MTMRELLPTMRSIGARLGAHREEPYSPAARRVRKPRAVSAVPPLRPRVEIPVCDPGPDAEARAALHARGQFLARQEDWEKLAAEIAVADKSRARTPGLGSVAQVLAEGARADVREAIAQAVARRDVEAVDKALAALEEVRADMPDSPAVAHVLAMAHVDAALAWRGAHNAADLPDGACAAYDRHMAVATGLTDRFDPFEHDSMLWAQVRCAVLDSDPAPRNRVADDYEDLIDLDPGCPWHLCALGRDLRPARFGEWAMLDLQARRSAARTADIWGVGGYTWVYLGALNADSGAFRKLDPELFVEGLHDIVARHGTQDMANRLAAFTGFTLGTACEAGSARHRLSECLGWIAQDHLREVHPLIWAEASAPRVAVSTDPEELDPARRGRMRAVNSLARFYAPALDAGHRLVVDRNGLRMVRDG